VPESDRAPWTPGPSHSRASDEAVVSQQIQLLALKRGKTVTTDRIRELLPQLLDTVCL
jgi:hypothetical protein